jgi:phosphoglycerate dehydrogenase-like enzyme
VAGSSATGQTHSGNHADRLSSNWAELPETGVLAGQTLGIIGLGRSGVALAERALGFGMRVIYHDIAGKSRDEARLGVRRRRFDQLLREADVLSLHLPVTPETRRLIDAPELASMKPTSTLINVSDGRLVDEGALIKALRGGDIAGAGLDAFAYEPLAADSPLIGFENVVLTPGLAWISEATEHEHWLRQIEQLLTDYFA